MNMYFRLILVLTIGCNTSIQLSPADRVGDSGLDASTSDVGVLPDGSFDAARQFDAAGQIDASQDAGAGPELLCGTSRLRFEHEEPAGFGTIWAASPTDQWLTGDRALWRWDGVTLSLVTLPGSEPTSEVLGLVGSMQGERSGPVALRRTLVSGVTWVYSMHRLDAGEWLEVELPSRLTAPQAYTRFGVVTLQGGDIWISHIRTDGVRAFWLYHFDGEGWNEYEYDQKVTGLSAAGEQEVAFRVGSEMFRASGDGIRPLSPAPVVADFDWIRVLHWASSTKFLSATRTERGTRLLAQTIGRRS